MTSTDNLDHITLDRPRYRTCGPRCLTRCECGTVPGVRPKGDPTPSAPARVVLTAARPSITLRPGGTVPVTNSHAFSERRVEPVVNPTISYQRTTPRRRHAAPPAPAVQLAPGALRVLTAPPMHAVGVALAVGDAVHDAGEWVILAATSSGRTMADDMAADRYVQVTAVRPDGGECLLTIAAGETYAVRLARFAR